MSITHTPNVTLSENTTYEWQVRYKGAEYGWSDWSIATSFSTEESFLDTSEVGVFTQGGYYAGDHNGYAILVAPGASGGSDQIEWSSDTNTSYGCTDPDDGVSNTDTMLNNDTTLSSGTATNFIDGVQTNGINGYNDWYIPAINELQLMYDNMHAPSADLTGTDWDNDGESYQSYFYWSSTEHSNSRADHLGFDTGSTHDYLKHNTYYVRAVRRVSI